jgi:hypothetical protein
MPVVVIYEIYPIHEVEMVDWIYTSYLARIGL